MKTVNPAAGDVIEEYDLMDNAEMDTIINSAEGAQKSWSEQSFEQRAVLLKKLLRF